MPLNDLGRRYADGLYVQETEKIASEFTEKTKTLRKGYFQRGLDSGQIYFLVLADVEPLRTEALARARAQSLYAAYEAAGLQVGEFEFGEIVREVKQVCDTRKFSIVGELGLLSVRTGGQYGSQSQALAAQLAMDIDSVYSRVVRELRIKLDAAALAAKRNEDSVQIEESKWDVFISYAGPDKDAFVRPLKDALERKGLRVWFDEVVLKVGDSLRTAIDRGLRTSMFGIVVLSPSFFERKWPQLELDGLLALETPARKKILPVWYHLTEDQVKTYSPILAGRYAARDDEGLDTIVQKLLQVIRPGDVHGGGE